jgi:hypothetical protein
MSDKKRNSRETQKPSQKIKKEKKDPKRHDGPAAK